MQLFAVDKIKYEMIGTEVSNMVSSVSTTPSIVIPKNIDYKLAIIRNNSPGTVYIGGSSVSPSNGFPVLKNEVIGISGFKGDLYAVTSTGSGELRILIFR